MTVEKKSVQTIHHRRCFSGFATVIFALAESNDLQLNTLAMLPALESREPSAGRQAVGDAVDGTRSQRHRCLALLPTQRRRILGGTSSGTLASYKFVAHP